MKIQLMVLVTLWLTTSCTEQSNTTSFESSSKFFTSNSSKVGLHNSIAITYEGTIAIATRTMEKFDENDPNDNVVFIEGDVLITHLENGGIEIAKKTKEVWFIPFLVGSDPIKLEAGYCWRYYCTCGGYPSWSTGNCEAAETTYSVGCRGSCEGSCVGFAMKVLCGSAPMSDPDIFNLYTGGVIVEASKVKIIDPEGKEFKPEKSIDFYQTSDGQIMKLEEAKKSGVFGK